MRRGLEYCVHSALPLTSDNTLPSSRLIRTGQRLRDQPDAGTRDIYRRILVRLVQEADRIPDFLWVTLEGSHHDSKPCAGGAFGTIYRGRTEGRDVAIKVTQVLIMVPEDIKARRVSSGFPNHDAT